MAGTPRMDRQDQTTSGLEAEFQTLHEFVKAARMRLNPMIWDYLVGATETETTMRRNRLALDTIALRPRVLRDVSEIDATWQALGKRLRLPLLLCPVGSLESMEAGGGLTVAEAAGRFGVMTMQSSVSPLSIEQARAAAHGPFTYQLYVRGDAAFVDDQLARAEAAGCDAFCLTVDTAHYSRRERDIAKRFAKPWRANVDEAARRYQMALAWPDVARIKARFRIPLVLKGIATAEDARLAVEHGVDVVYVSNHGGRQLDHGRGALDILPEVVDAVGGKAKVWVDGGITRGTDMVKAMALGADLVGIGRLYCYALAAAGSAGIVRMLEILEDEVHSALGLIGATSFAALDRTYLHTGAPAVFAPHVHSAFPLLNLDDEGYGGR
ncbi:MAG: alpha-hydroxy acid oxidase [Hyphomicrobiaceae bacterium]